MFPATYDTRYQTNPAFLKIIIQTFIKVCKRENVADLTKGIKDKDGKVHIWVDGKECILHQPLHIEREKKSV